jgi:hypothetical protein
MLDCASLHLIGTVNKGLPPDPRTRDQSTGPMVRALKLHICLDEEALEAAGSRIFRYLSSWP